MKNIYLFMASLMMLCPLFCNRIVAQEHNHETCKFHEAQSSFWEAHPDAYKAYLEQQKHQDRLIRSMKRSKKKYDAQERYIIPVVFHVFGKEQAGKSVTTALIQEAITKLNSDYAQRSVGQDQIHPTFKSLLGVMPVEFRLAKKDPNGYMTSGVTFHGVASGFGHSNGYDEQIQKYAWDNTKYMNVYIMNDLYNDGDTYNSGVAWYPNEYMTQNNLARVVYNGAFLSSNTSENFRRVLTHEFGHFLNLAHTFQGGCPEADGGDHCDDTPAADASHMGIDQQNCHGVITNTQNFMNYTDDYEMFTKDQVLRMRAAMQHPARVILWQPENLEATGVADTYVPTFGIGYGSDTFEEAFLNNGTIANSLEINLLNGLHFKDVDLVANQNYFVSNVPEGVSLKVVKQDNQTARLSLEGTALAHDKDNSMANLTLRFSEDLFVEQGQTISLLENSHIKISFKDPYTAYHYPSSSYRAYSGITKVKFATIDNTSEVTNATNYFDNHMAVVAVGQDYDLEITMNQFETGATDSYIIHAWLDKNGDFVFTEDEAIVDHTMNFKDADEQGNYLYKQTITIPEDFITGKKVGLRILTAYNTGDKNSSGYDPQGAYESGEFEDYSVKALETVTELTPDFSLSSDKILLRHHLKVLDLSNSPSNDPITQWHWTFEGGKPKTFDGKMPPEIYYEKEGAYDIQLEVTTASGVKKVLNKDNAITVEENYCEPNTQYATYSGITRVKIGTMVHQTENMARYMDYHSQKEIAIQAGTEVPYEIDLDQGLSGANDLIGVHIWCDWNHNSEFDADELAVFHDVEIASFQNNSTSLSGTIMVPIDASGERSRVRIMVYYRGDKRDYIASPCDAIESGEIEDYSLMVSPSDKKVSIDFSADKKQVVVGNTVQFSDLTRVVQGHHITSRVWTLVGATPSTSTEKDPQVVYNKEGVYPVKLKVTLDNGESFILERDNYVEAVYKVCEVTQEWGTKFGHIQSIEVGKVNHVLPDVDIPVYTNLYKSHVVEAQTGQQISWRVVCHKGESGDRDAIGFKIFFDADRNGLTVADQIFYDHFNAKDVDGEKVFEGTFTVPDTFDETETAVLRFVAYYEGTYWAKKFDVNPCDKLDSGNGVDFGIGKTDKSTGVNKLSQQNSNILIYPNPVSGLLSILSNDHAIKNVKVYDINGIVYYDGKYNTKEIRLSFDQVSPGTYFVLIETVNGKEVRKVIKK
ncbi:T9SS type A sorting domain-containing protein [Halosquirtibacter xylanolyticus]|uniref:zinc-dependent metalloprotease n=1 Tax=Halosquirtibacter xylanolyticus TaxID=3374599 RepID=UPI003748A438|nr:T9SS type A sorting domain-containing protein [Prolixibacteraceae bacterium]